MLALLIPGVGMGGGEAVALVTVPDVTGQSEADAITAIEAEGLVAVVEYANSSSVETGLVVSYAPTGDVVPGSTITITVSLGDADFGGHFVPDDDERQRKKIEDREQLRELIERAAGLIEDAPAIIAQPDKPKPRAAKTRHTGVPNFAPHVADLRSALDAFERGEREQSERVQAKALLAAAHAALATSAIDHLIVAVTEIVEDIIRDLD